MGQHPATKLVHNLSWLEVVTVNNRQVVQELQELYNLDLGESEAIALAEGIEVVQLLIDEKRGRRVALARKTPIIGTVGILLLAKRRGLLDSIKDILDEMQVQGTRISAQLYVQVLTLAEEMGD
jgi:predicted nucleic acid-binding protein